MPDFAAETALDAAVGQLMRETAQSTLMRHYQNLATRDVTSKAADDVVTIADTESEVLLAQGLAGILPEAAIVGEEAAHADPAVLDHLSDSLCWIIDPLDGTNNFVHGIPHFAVSIAYYEAGQAQCGVVFNPVRGEWYTAQRGAGASCNGQPIRVAGDTRLSEVLVGLGFYYDRGAMMQGTLNAIRDLFAEKIHGIRRFGTASLDLCHVAQGRFGAFFEFQLSPWDFAAGGLIVEEAGGRVTTCRGEPLPLRLSSVLASNGALHDAVLRIVQPHLPPQY